MGANNSTRKLTLVNDEKAGVIKLSESLAHRLRGQLENAQETISEPEKEIPKPYSTPQYVPSPPPPPPSPPPPPPSPPPSQLEPSKLEDQPSQEIQGEKSGEVIPAWSIYAKEAHLMSARLREEKELELKLRDEEWRNKLKEREKQYAEMSQLSHDHMQNTIKEVEGLFTKVSCSPVCQEQQSRVMKCYKNNSSQTLRCSDEVESFGRCVDLSRLQAIMKEKAS